MNVRYENEDIFPNEHWEFQASIKIYLKLFYLPACS